jgi:hypothetical protein
MHDRTEAQQNRLCLRPLILAEMRLDNSSID